MMLCHRWSLTTGTGKANVGDLRTLLQHLLFVNLQRIQKLTLLLCLTSLVDIDKPDSPNSYRVQLIVCLLYVLKSSRKFLFLIHSTSLFKGSKYLTNLTDRVMLLCEIVLRNWSDQLLVVELNFRYLKYHFSSVTQFRRREEVALFFSVERHHFGRSLHLFFSRIPIVPTNNVINKLWRNWHYCKTS